MQLLITREIFSDPACENLHLESVTNGLLNESSSMHISSGTLPFKCFSLITKERVCFRMVCHFDEIVRILCNFLW